VFEQKAFVRARKAGGPSVSGRCTADEFREFRAVLSNGWNKKPYRQDRCRREGPPGGVHGRRPARRHLEHGAATNEREPEDLKREQLIRPMGRVRNVDGEGDRRKKYGLFHDRCDLRGRQRLSAGQF